MNALLEDLAARGIDVVIPPRRNRNIQRVFDREAYCDRHRMENVFATIKEFRAIAPRYDKTALSSVAGVNLVAGVIAAR